MRISGFVCFHKTGNHFNVFCAFCGKVIQDNRGTPM